MHPDHIHFGFWAILIMTVVAGVILLEHGLSVNLMGRAMLRGGVRANG
jgi:hypothetical protein